MTQDEEQGSYSEPQVLWQPPAPSHQLETSTPSPAEHEGNSSFRPGSAGRGLSPGDSAELQLHGPLVVWDGPSEGTTKPSLEPVSLRGALVPAQESLAEP